MCRGVVPHNAYDRLPPHLGDIVKIHPAIYLLIALSSVPLGANAQTVKLEVPLISDTVSTDLNLPKNTFSIGKDITKPQQAAFRGPAQSFAAVFGVVGALATMGAARSEGEQLAEFMEKHNINAGEIFSKELEKQIKEFNKNIIVDSAATKPVLTIEVVRYGLTKKDAFGTKLCPVLSIEAKIKNADGTILWKNKDYIANMNSENNVAETLETFHNDPSKLRSGFENISRILAKIFVDNMKQSIFQ